jgi:hypothetical protein
MPNFAIIENGKVVNVVVAEPDFAAQRGWVSLPVDAGIDWDYVDGQFVDNRPVPERVAPPTLTREELLAQISALAAQVQALE